MWNYIRHVALKIFWDHLVWHSASISHAIFVLWLAIKNNLTTLDHISQYAPHANLNCVLCDSELESHSHLLCWVLLQWRSLQACVDEVWVPSSTLLGLLLWSMMQPNGGGKSLPMVVRKLSLAITVYCIWCEWNNHIFNNCRKPHATVLQLITNMIHCRLYTLKVKPSTSNMGSSIIEILLLLRLFKSFAAFPCVSWALIFSFSLLLAGAWIFLHAQFSLVFSLGFALVNIFLLNKKMALIIWAFIHILGHLFVAHWQQQ